jgi:hypothetical protein
MDDSKDNLDIIKEVHRLKNVPYCLCCGEDVMDQGVFSMSGPGRSLWVHIESGFPSCRPGQPNSPSAVPIFPQDITK